jgi:membrane peptidoglycan carboxypeptidase
MKPYIVKKEVSPDGSVIFENFPSPVRQVISTETSNKLNQMFIGVIERGTGTDAKIEGLKIAGKTGTTQKIVEGEYSSSSHISSFVGYFPADNPEIIITIILDEPKNGFYGGKVAAPVFQKIATRIMGFNDIINLYKSESITSNTEKEINDKNNPDKDRLLPNLLNLRVKDAIEILSERNIGYELDKDLNSKELQGKIISVNNQEPAPGSKLEDGKKMKLFIKDSNIDNTSLVIVPDVRKMSLRKSINKLVSEGFIVDVNGSGEVVDIFPKPGNKVNSKSKVILFCKEEN